MDVHKNAPLTPCGREAMVRRIVEGGQTPEAVSAAVGVCPKLDTSLFGIAKMSPREKPRRNV